MIITLLVPTYSEINICSKREISGNASQIPRLMKKFTEVVSKNFCFFLRGETLVFLPEDCHWPLLLKSYSFFFLTQYGKYMLTTIHWGGGGQLKTSVKDTFSGGSCRSKLPWHLNFLGNENLGCSPDDQCTSDPPPFPTSLVDQSSTETFNPSYSSHYSKIKGTSYSHPPPQRPWLVNTKYWQLNSIDSLQLNRSIPASVPPPPALSCLIQP